MRAFAFVFAFMAVPAWAATPPPLLPPLMPSATGVVFSPPSCGPMAPNPVAAVHLLLQTRPRDLGPYRVTLDGYGTPEQPDTIRPILVQTNSGSTLRFDLDNQLTPSGDGSLSETNLHTHGLIVRPVAFPDHPCPGDFVFQHTQPGGADALRSYKIDIPTAIPNTFFGVGAPGGTTPHPTGLFWFHAHWHGVARAQVTSGFSGLLSVGDPKTNLRVDQTVGPVSVVDEVRTTSLREQTDVHTLGLRDIQLQVPCAAGRACADTLPGGAAATTGLANVVVDPQYNPALCLERRITPGVDELSPLNSGWCAAKPASDGSPNHVWLFTVNGQLFPDLAVAPDRNLLLRLANLSASLSYGLELADVANPSTTLPLCVIALDGVVSGTAGTTCSGGEGAGTSGTFGEVGFPAPRLLLMPASRAEVFLPYEQLRGSGVRELVLRTVGTDMRNGEENSQGDQWPAIELMRITVHPRPAPLARAMVVLRANLVRTAVGPRAALAVARAARPVPFDLAALRRAHPSCRFMPPGEGFRRQIIFDEDEAVTSNGQTVQQGSFPPHASYGLADAPGFALGSRVVNSADPPHVLAGSPIPPTPYGGKGTHGTMTMDGVPGGAHVCPVLGREEVWELQNWTSETHNFHIHQGKFRIARAGDPGLPDGFKDGDAVSGGGTGPLQVRSFLVALGGSPSIQAWHDTLPVPPRTTGADGKPVPGKLFVTIPFRAAEQVGDFVFHCHILEHEDKGMMAHVEVVAPRPGRRVGLLARN